MKKPKPHIIFFALLLFAGCGLVRSQYKIADGNDLLTLQQVPMEKAYLHLSTATLFSGEYLYYKFYNLNAATGRLSRISRVAYVSLVNPSGKEVFTQKLRLNRGMAYGDFFANTELLTGDYTLVGYTRWMQNGGLEQAFRQRIRIINPYNTAQEGIPREIGDSTDTGSPALSQEKYPDFTPTEGGLIELKMDTTHYDPRAPFELRIRNFKGRLGHGEYSIALKRLQEFPGPARMSATQYGTLASELHKTLPKRVGDSVALPEQRGELIYGQVVSPDGPVSGQEVFLSIPGEQYVIKSIETDNAGNFFAYLREPYVNNRLILQAPSPEPWEITRKESPGFDFTPLIHEPIALDSRYRDSIVRP